jgi:hypothetical protein
MIETKAKILTYRRTTRAPARRRMVRRFPTSAIILMVFTAGCGKSDPERDKGLYAYCDGTADGLHYIHGISHQAISYFSLPCLGPEFFSETGDTGDTGSGEISLSEWTNDTEDIDALRTMCVEECQNHAGGECEQKDGKMWQIRNYKGDIVPDPLMKIRDPWHLECTLPKAKLAPLPRKTQVIPVASAPVWPNADLPIVVGCEDFETCANELATPIGMFLYYDDTAVPWGADMGHADHVATTSPGASMLELTIVNQGSTPSSDSHEIGGRIEYTAPDCDESTCPFYLANLALSNTTETWELYSESLKENVYVTDIAMQLRRPTLGVWNTSSNEFYVGAERIDAYVSGTIQIGGGSPVEMGFLVTNVEAIFGEIGAESTIKILGFTADDGGNLALEADLDFDLIATESLPIQDLSP